MDAASPRPATPVRAGIVLTALVLAAVVCNINVAAATVALPSIGDAFGASQTALNLVGIGNGLGLAMSVLYLGAVADRYGRKRLLLIGLSLTVVASVASAAASSVEALVLARVFTGLAAGAAYPTTLSLITALWADGPARTRAIALWSSVSAMASVGGSVLAGIVLTDAGWRPSFLMAIPLALVAAVLVAWAVPSRVAESEEPVDHIGGVLSVVGVGALVLGIGIVFDPGEQVPGIVLVLVAVVAIGGFGWRQRRTRFPLFDLHIARRRLFWAPAVAGTIAFGALLGAIFVGEQFLQNVLGYDPLKAGAAVIPAAVGLLIAVPFAARLVGTRGTRWAMLLGYAIILAAFLTMLGWRESTPYALVGVGFLFVGAGAAFVMTASSRSLTGSTPVRRVGMASAASDLQGDLGGSIMQALLGAILAAGFAGAVSRHIADSGRAGEIGAEVTAALQASFASAAHVAQAYPADAGQILAAARESLAAGAWAAYLVGAIVLVAGALVVRFGIPDRRGEARLHERYRADDERMPQPGA
ncbi:MAG: MFS transporter [Microbacterium ginsengisoli]|nr:MFS transporter [Microbacterium sp. Leaf347]KQS05864.1 MFS transporter [Microbacterium sp. Leaf351]MBN9197727.1 MFS transporter [Microbacterium ginsengisoli]OJU79544.1 MAG: MFS transporter [Microbacterium sp. 71-23]